MIGRTNAGGGESIAGDTPEEGFKVSLHARGGGTGTAGGYASMSIDNSKTKFRYAKCISVGNVDVWDYGGSASLQVNGVFAAHCGASGQMNIDGVIDLGENPPASILLDARASGKGSEDHNHDCEVSGVISLYGQQ